MQPCGQTPRDWGIINITPLGTLAAEVGTWKQWPGRLLGSTGWDPSVCKSDRSHVHILRFSCIKLWYILYISLKWLVIFLQSWTSTGSSLTNCRFSPIIAWEAFQYGCIITIIQTSKVFWSTLYHGHTQLPSHEFKHYHWWSSERLGS